MIMFRVVIFFIYISLAVATPDDPWIKCYGLHTTMIHCCTGITMGVPSIWEHLKECYITKTPEAVPLYSCEVDECVGKKFGYYDDEGFSKERFMSFTEKKIENNVELVAAVKDKCLNGDISKYGHPDMCDILKMQYCFDNQFMKLCTKWSDEVPCKGFEDIVQECFVDD